MAPKACSDNTKAPRPATSLAAPAPRMLPTTAPRAITFTRRRPSRVSRPGKEAVITQKNWNLPISRGRSNLTFEFSYFVDGPEVIPQKDVSSNNKRRRRGASRHLLGSSYLEFEASEDSDETNCDLVVTKDMLGTLHVEILQDSNPWNYRDYQIPD